MLFTTPFTSNTWHNFAIEVNWTNLTLAIFYSEDDEHLKAVTDVVPNSSVAQGPNGQGDFHFGVLKARVRTFTYIE